LSTPQRALRPTEGARIFIIRSEPDLEKGLDEMLRRAGYHVEIASESTLVVDSIPPEAVLVLLVTSGSSCEMGAVCSALKYKRSNLPIIVLGPDVVSVKLHFFEYGAADYIPPLIDRAELLARIKSVIRRNPSK